MSYVIISIVFLLSEHNFNWLPIRHIKMVRILRHKAKGNCVVCAKVLDTPTQSAEPRFCTPPNIAPAVPAMPGAAAGVAGQASRPLPEQASSRL